MPKQITSYVCSYCKYTLRTEKGILSHEKTCKHSPITIEAHRTKTAFELAVKDIQTTSKNVPELLSRLAAYLRTVNIELTINSYPDKWSNCASNSHSAPAGYEENWCGMKNSAGVPNGYPGWTGRWEGTIKYLTSTKETYFSLLRDRIPFIHTESGCSGANFSIEGKLFLYDFPTMHEEWKGSGAEFNLIGDEFTLTLSKLKSEYVKATCSWIEQQKDSIAIAVLKKELYELSSLLTKVSVASNSYYNSVYRNENPLTIPELPSAFVDLKEYQLTKNLQVIKQIDKPDIDILYNKAFTLAATLNTYKTKHAEYFI